MALTTRKPTGIPSWPLILLEGEEKAGKSWACAEFSGSERVGTTYWLELGEGKANEYGAVPGADYEIIEHNGTWTAIMDAVVEVAAIGRQALARGDKPVVLIIDSMSSEWDLLKAWANMRARKNERARSILEKDPDAEIEVYMNYWNDATDRHMRLMNVLMTFPGIVVMTARGKEVAALDENGRPIKNTREYKVEGQKMMAHQATVWVRMSRTRPPVVVGAAAVHGGIRPGVDDAKPVPHFSLDWLVFDVLKCGSESDVRDMIPHSGSDVPVRPPVSDSQITEYEDKLTVVANMDEVNALQNEALAAGEYNDAGVERMKKAIQKAKERIARGAMAPLNPEPVQEPLEEPAP